MRAQVVWNLEKGNFRLSEMEFPTAKSKLSIFQESAANSELQSIYSSARKLYSQTFASAERQFVLCVSTLNSNRTKIQISVTIASKHVKTFFGEKQKKNLFSLTQPIEQNFLQFLTEPACDVTPVEAHANSSRGLLRLKWMNLLKWKVIWCRNMMIFMRKKFRLLPWPADKNETEHVFCAEANRVFLSRSCIDVDVWLLRSKIEFNQSFIFDLYFHSSNVLWIVYSNVVEDIL